MENYENRKFGKLFITSYIRGVGKHSYWECLCDCGTVKTIRIDAILAGVTVSCGCYQRSMTASMKRTHGMSDTKEYKAWESMISRCCNPNHKYYHKYGGAGIAVDELFVKDFVEFYTEIGPYPSDGVLWTVDRINNNLGYIKGNIRWATKKTQAENRGIPSHNTSGIKGVQRVSAYNSWKAEWVAVDGKKRSKNFSDKKYGGKELALAAAIAYRISVITNLNKNGASYCMEVEGHLREMWKEMNNV